MLLKLQHTDMKSAYERALERFGPVNDISDEKKAEIAEIEGRYKAKIAQVELRLQAENANAEGELLDGLKLRAAAEIAEFRERCEKEKDKIRNAD